MDEANQTKRTKIDPECKKSDNKESGVCEDAIDSDALDKQFYWLVHPLENLDSTPNNDPSAHGKRKVSTHRDKPPVNTLRLAEDTRFFYSHLHARGRLHLHRTPSPLVSYRHRSGMSQSSNTPRKLLLKLRVKAWEDLVFQGNTATNNNTKWADGFAIWGAGRDGKDFLKALSPEVVSKVVCFVDVDQKKIETIKWYHNPAMGNRRIPILHFSILAKNNDSEQVTFGHIDKKQCGEDSFNIVPKHPARPNDQHHKCKQKAQSKTTDKQKKMTKAQNSIDPEVLKQLPVVVCVAMYRTNGALESNVASIGRVEGEDLWHFT